VLAESSGAPPSAAGVLLAPISERSGNLQLRAASVRTYRYRPARSGRAPGVVLLHGVHPRGIDEPRLIAFARALARGGLDVLTPELPELLEYRLERSTSGEIRQLAAAHAASTHTAAVGVIGISFAGGLALIAAAEQHARAPIGFVAAVGAHDDLLRLCDYYAGHDVRGPDAERAPVPPHPYGARVLLREQLGLFFAPADLPLARRALDTYLSDRHWRARALARGLSPAGRSVMDVLLAPGSSPELSALIERACTAAAPQLRAASPHGQLRGLRVPVYLLHGRGDPIIPSIALGYLAREVPAPWLRAALVTPLLRHAELSERPAPRETWRLVRFISALFDAAGSAASQPPDADGGAPGACR
jgi:pimeloyl-ACP methyl ester carboxylesterase